MLTLPRFIYSGIFWFCHSGILPPPDTLNEFRTPTPTTPCAAQLQNPMGNKRIEPKTNPHNRRPGYPARAGFGATLASLLARCAKRGLSCYSPYFYLSLKTVGLSIICNQRTGLYAGGELVFSPPKTTDDWKYFVEVKTKSWIWNDEPKLLLMHAHIWWYHVQTSFCKYLF